MFCLRAIEFILILHLEEKLSFALLNIKSWSFHDDIFICITLLLIYRLHLDTIIIIKLIILLS